MQSVADMPRTTPRSREEIWSLFLARLQESHPWAYHSLLKGEAEMTLHDMYLEGEISLLDVRTIIALEVG